MANIIITGANQGIGYYFAEKALIEGHKVAVLDIETKHIAELKPAHSTRLFIETVDVCDISCMQEAVKNVMAQFGTIDIAIHNACICPFVREKDAEIDVYEKTFDVNYYGGLRLTKCVLPYMREQRSGKIIFTSSGVGVTGFSSISPYASTKGALEALAKCLNLEYAQDGISFHLMHPPLTRTKSAALLPVPDEFKAEPKIVGYGLMKHIFSKQFIICHSFGQKVQILGSYLFPIKMGKLLSKMTMNVVSNNEKNSD